MSAPATTRSASIAALLWNHVAWKNAMPIPSSTLVAGISTSACCLHKGRLKAPLPRADERRRRRPERVDRTMPSGEGAEVEQGLAGGRTAPKEPKPELVERFMGLMTPKEQKQVALQSIMTDFARFPGDTGSSEVQVALLTSKISSLAEHLKVHRKDYSSKRGLMAMLNQRRQTLQYLRRNNFERYTFCLAKLGLKDIGKTFDRLSSRYSE